MPQIINYQSRDYEVVNNSINIDGKQYTLFKGAYYQRKIEDVFIDSKITSIIDIFTNENSPFLIVNCIFNEDVVLEYATISNCIFARDSYFNNVSFHNISSTQRDTTIFYGKTIFEYEFTIQSWKGSSGFGTNRKDKNISPNLVFKNTTNFQNITFEKTKLFLDLIQNNEADFSFVNCRFTDKFKIRSIEYDDNLGKGRSYEKQQRDKAEVKSLRFINCELEDNTYFRVGLIQTKFFTIKNLRNPQNAELNIGDCHFKSFKLTNFRNIGKFKLFKINILDSEKNISQYIKPNGYLRQAPLYILNRIKRIPPLFMLCPKSIKDTNDKKQHFK